MVASLRVNQRKFLGRGRDERGTNGCGDVECVATALNHLVVSHPDQGVSGFGAQIPGLSGIQSTDDVPDAVAIDQMLCEFVIQGYGQTVTISNRINLWHCFGHMCSSFDFLLFCTFFSW